MTTEEIRKCIKITHFHSSHNGVHIIYDWSTKPSEAWEEKNISIQPKELLQELNSMGEINIWGVGIEYNEVIHPNYLQFIEHWIFSQWDALNLVIHYEYNKAVEEDVNNSDIGNAINKLLK